MRVTARAPSATPALVRPFAEFFRLESAGGILLLVATASALLVANSGIADAYFSFWESYVTIGGGTASLTKSLLHWVNDGLMAVFFFVVGLEIKREILTGELSALRKAALPVLAAFGGMVVPASIYLLFNPSGETVQGWGIPMATDIAFALGILALVGRNAPLGLKVFLTAVAIIDDIGAVLVIALFYTSQLNGAALLAAGLVLLLLAAVNRAGTRSVVVYAVLGILLWIAVLKSGVHATVAGVVLALFIPARRVIDPSTLVERARGLLDTLAGTIDEQGPPEGPTPDQDQRDAINSLENLTRHAQAPLTRLEESLHPWVAFLIVPLFAFANAGVVLDPGALGRLFTPVVSGITAGLVVGKPLGVFLCAWLAVRLGLGDLPEGVRWRQIAGVAVLCGVGFTMSLFIGGLAFDETAVLEQAKIGILLGSGVSAIVGGLLIRSASAQEEDHPREHQEHSEP